MVGYWFCISCCLQILGFHLKFVFLKILCHFPHDNKKEEKRETDLDLLFLLFIPNYFLQQNLFFFFFFFHLCFDPKSNFGILKS